MKNETLVRVVLATALLIFAVPIVGSAQDYYQYDRDDQSVRVDVRDALNQLEDSSARLQNDVNYGRNRSVLGGLFWVRTVDNDAIVQVRDFRQAVSQLRLASRGGWDLDNSADEAQVVLDRGMQLDRYLRVRTGSTSVDSDLADLRSSLHVIADAYDLSMPY